MKRFLLLLLALPLMQSLWADTPVVRARVEPDSVFIGDRFDYVIEIDKDLVQTTHFPTFSAKDGMVELVEELPVDTLKRDGRRLRIAKRYRLAAFQEGLINMGAAGVVYADKNIVDTLYAADSVYLKVATFQIDSTSQSIFDLKPQQNLPFKVAEIKSYLLWGLLALVVLVALMVALDRYLKARGRRLGDLFKPAPPQPPHVIAIAALEALHHQKLWQNNKHKLYYSLLTEILRTYIDGRWGVSAMEMTSDEIIAAMHSVELPDKARMDLTAILRDADLVKFAKFAPEAEQNENDYQKAYYFVEETKPVEENPSAEEGPLSKTEK
ncbi:MAG: hypothetical protein IIV06_02910 [Alistipes sp.]|nr:hypothetical protein [Alistipes sp.]